MRDEGALDSDTIAKNLDRAHFRVISVRTDAHALVRAAAFDEAVWLPVRPEDLEAAIPLAVGLGLSDRPSPLRQAAAEATDRYVLRATRGGVDPRLRQRDFGAVPVCRPGDPDCKSRRKALRILRERFAGNDACNGGECMRYVLVKRSWETAAPPFVRLELAWDLDGCALSHIVDVGFGTSDASVLAQSWSMADRRLDMCTLDGFPPDGCTVELDRSTHDATGERSSDQTIRNSSDKR
jgi:hypothetical protein